MSDLPFTFYWADETETTFDPDTMNVFDEDIFSFNVQHDEGQIPTLDLIVRNPRIGLLAPGRKVWAWLAWWNGTELVPLFFGVLVGVPTSLFQEKVTLQFIARSPQFIRNKQELAETMKTSPYYDAVFIDADKRDDPDTILEGWSALWHIDRTSLAITASDILEGEDGTVTFDESHAFYDSVSLSLGQPPLDNIRVEASVNWTQRTSGFFTVPPVNVSSYTGETLISDWPKPGSSIGGGYKCESSFVTDTYFVSQTPTTTYNSSWTNTDPNPGQCSNATSSYSSSGPALLSPDPLQNVLTIYLKSGVCFPDSDPPTNTPMELTSSGVIIPLWNVSMSMIMRYDASRAYSEQIAFDMIANVQGILASPTVDQHTELMTVNGCDVGQPLIEVDAWTDFASRPVGLAQVIFPNNPTEPGGLSYQICVTAGIAGANEPVFSDIPGALTVDGSVHWASIGSQGVSQAAAWSPGAGVPLGQIMLLRNQTFNINTGSFEDIPGATSYYLCTRPGTSNGIYEQKTFIPPVTSNVEPTPAERIVSFIRQPDFATSNGTLISDGSVEWTVLGTSPALLGIPIGGTADEVTASNYFPTARGLLSVEYLISRARARLRFRSRAVKIGWEAKFDDVVPLSCRKNASLFDPRLPGGAATGKVTSYSLSCSGDGKLIGKVEIGCPIGFGDTINEIDGTPEYVDAGYVQLNYQIYDGAMIAHGSNDTTFTPPASQSFDDGLQFPLRWEDISDGGLQSGKLSEQKAAIEASFVVARELNFLNQVGGSIQGGAGGTGTTVSGQSPDVAWQVTREQMALLSQNTPYVMAANPISWSCLLKPCAGNGPFGGAYSIVVSPLVVPQGINLEAPSSP